MPQITQYSTQTRLTTPQIEQWRELVPRILPAFRADVEAQGGRCDHAPDLPQLGDPSGVQGYIDEPFRILMAWVPDWSPNPDRGYHVIRVDTCEPA